MRRRRNSLGALNTLGDTLNHLIPRDTSPLYPSSPIVYSYDDNFHLVEYYAEQDPVTGSFSIDVLAIDMKSSIVF